MPDLADRLDALAKKIAKPGDATQEISLHETASKEISSIAAEMRKTKSESSVLKE